MDVPKKPEDEVSPNAGSSGDTYATSSVEDGMKIISLSSNNDDDDDLDAQSSSHGSKVSPPITLLQEICSRNGFTPEYQLLSTEGSVHEPTFKIAVTVDDITVTASGQSKKKARHAAAREAIDKLRERVDLNFDGINFDLMAPIGETSEKSVYATAISEANPIGKLQEICMKMRVNPPDYETCDEKGLAHERIFVLSCTIASLNMTTLGSGRSKKLAKRQAAESMLIKLENSEFYDKNASSKPGNDLGASSLNMDFDDPAYFVKARRQVTEMTSRIDCSIDDLKNDIKMIEEDDVDESLCYNLLLETMTRTSMRADFRFESDTICLLSVLDEEDKVVIANFGKGASNVLAMKDSVIKTYKSIIVLLEPSTRKDLPSLPVVGIARRQEATGP